METKLVDLLVGDCDHILRLNPIVSAYASNLIAYKNKASRKSGLLLDDNSLRNAPSGERLIYWQDAQ